MTTDPTLPTARSTGWYLLPRLAAALAAAALVAVLSGGVASPVGAQEGAPNRTIAAYEVKFLEEMAHHHHMAVMMSMVCVERAAELRPELAALCREIIATQNRETAMMLSWLRSWYGISYSPHEDMGPEMMEMMEDMRAMSPAEFERFFVEDMIVHHAAALQPARQCQGKAYHEELASLCRDIVEVQVGEIDLMREWLCQWFGECNFHIDPHRRRAMHG